MALAKLLCVLLLIVGACSAQTTPQANTPPPDQPITLLRKSVVFIELLCKDGRNEFNVKGTGFFVGYPDKRGKGAFIYLITNRHVALCWNDAGHPMQVESISVSLNRRQAEGDSFVEKVHLNDHGNIPWVLPSDDSIDLAAIPLGPDPRRFDIVILPISMLATRDVLSENRVTEGDAVFFSGFFYQFPGTKRVQPIVRQGTIAMMPDEKIPFVTTPEKLFLADLHVFGGNSGSPAFINLAGFHNGGMIAGTEYRLLGVVNGEMSEDENFNLQLTATIAGTARANSGVSTIVPADDLKALLDGPELQGIRDQVEAAAHGKPPSN